VDADPQVQLRLLDLQELDSGIDRLAARRRTLPDIAEIERLTARLRELGADLDTAESAKNETARAQARLEADVENVRSRAVRDQGRLDSGAVSSSRELENLQSEIASLNRRRDTLEDELLELMEAAENAASAADALNTERHQMQADRAAAVERRDAEWAAIDEDSTQQRAARAELAPQLPVDLVTLYERIRASSGGIGAARIYRRRCEGCHMELSGGDLSEVVEAPPERVLRHEECRRILIRTEESGL
jgi:predicted  nucleic acid-binding Zn-ribbon protein